MAKILIVDDSALSRRMLRRILEGASHSVIEADDGMVAIEKYFLEKPDLVMLDLIMKGISGMEVLQKIRQMDQSARSLSRAQTFRLRRARLPRPKAPWVL